LTTSGVFENLDLEMGRDRERGQTASLPMLGCKSTLEHLKVKFCQERAGEEK
jgi:hypothetical protein